MRGAAEPPIGAGPLMRSRTGTCMLSADEESPQMNHPPRARSFARSAALVALTALFGLTLATPAQARGRRRSTRPPSSKTAVAKATLKKANGLLRSLKKTKPGPERYPLVDELIALGDGVWPTVEAGLGALSKLNEGEAVVVDLLLGFGAASYDATIARAAGLSDGAANRVLRAALRRPDDERQTKLLLAVLPRRDAQILLQVLPVLLPRAPEPVLQRLVTLIDDDRADIVAYAADTLGARSHKPALTVLVRRLGIEQRRATADNNVLRRKLIRAIGRIGGDAAVPPLFEAMRLPDQKPTVLDALRATGGPAIRAALFLLRTADGARLEIALDVLTHMPEQAAPALLSLLDINDRSTRLLASDVFAHIAVPQVREAIVERVRQRRFVDLSDGIRLAVVLYDPSVRKLLLDLLKDSDPSVRVAVLEELEQLRDPLTFPAMWQVAAQDPDPAVRLAALEDVIGVDDPEALPLLRQMTGAQNRDERILAIEAIGRLDDIKTGVPALAAQLADPNERVFRAALGALRRMCLHDAGQRAAGWLRWAKTHGSKPGRLPKDALVRKLSRKGQPDVAYATMGDDDEDFTILVISGPPFATAHHLAPAMWKLADDHRVAVWLDDPASRTAAGASHQARAGHLDVVLQDLRRRHEDPDDARYVILADGPGAHFALWYASARRQYIHGVVLHGGPWPTTEALAQLPGQVVEAIHPLLRPDYDWALRGQWRLAPRIRERVMMRALLTGMVGNWERARAITVDHLTDDGLGLLAYERARVEHRRWSPEGVLVPVLVLLGERAPWADTTTAALSSLGAEPRKLVRSKRLKGAGAFPMFERREQTVDALEDFFDRIED